MRGGIKRSFPAPEQEGIVVIKKSIRVLALGQSRNAQSLVNLVQPLEVQGEGWFRLQF